MNGDQMIGDEFHSAAIAVTAEIGALLGKIGKQIRTPRDRGRIAAGVDDEIPHHGLGAAMGGEVTALAGATALLVTTAAAAAAGIAGATAAAAAAGAAGATAEAAGAAVAGKAAEAAAAGAVGTTADAGAIGTPGTVDETGAS